jgi:hypothetical protein
MSVKADTNFDPNNTDHFRVEYESGSMGFSRAKIRVFTLETSGINDGMRSIELFYVLNGVETKICYFGTDDAAKVCSKFVSENTIDAGYMHEQSTEGDRYTTVYWIYPQKLNGKTVQIRYKWQWDININGVDQTGTNDFYLTLPSITSPAPIGNPLLSIINGDSDGKWFKFSWNSFDKSLNLDYSMNGQTCKSFTTLKLYSDADGKTLIGTSVNTDGGAGNLYVNIPNSLLNKINTIYPKLEYTINSTYDKKTHYYSLPPVTSKGFTSPVLGSNPFDRCTKKVTLNWIYQDPSDLDPNTKVYIYRKSDAESVYKLVSGALEKNITAWDDTDASLLWDTQYNYIIRSCPTFLTASDVKFTNATAANYLPELLQKATVLTSRQVIDLSTKFTATANIAQGTKVANVEIKWSDLCSCPPQYLTLTRINTLNANDEFSQQVLTSSGRYVDTDVINNNPYKYQLSVDNGGRIETGAWVSANVTDQCKFLKLTTTKGVLNDRVRLSWEIDKPLLNQKFIIKRKIFDNGSDLFDYEQIAEKQSTNSIENWEDLSVSPGILYKYQIVSYYQPPIGSLLLIPTVDSIGSGLGFSQPIGTISGAIAFGSGTAVEGVNVAVLNTDNNQKLYKSMEFSQTGSRGNVALKSKKHGCIETGFTWQAMLKPVNRTQVNACIYEMNSEYSFRINANKINVFVNPQSLTVPVLSKDISSIAANKFFQLSISYNSSTKHIKLYIDGICNDSATLNSTYTCQNKSDAKLAASFLNGVSYYKGLIDEMRLWSRALTKTEIKTNFDRYLSGSEADLIGYWQMDEGINGFAFDKSNYNKSYNENHITMLGVACSDTIPTLAQLSIKSNTDKNGNYLIQGVPYRGSGSTYNVIPALGTHEFEPSSQQIFIGGTSSEVQSKISFKDISSFSISGYIYYENTTYPVDGVQFSVDGNTCTRENKIISSGYNKLGVAIPGYYEIDVPIGEHKITMFKNGHTFINKDADATLILGQTYNFKENKTYIDFKDLTKVTLVGRVVGGAIQAAKPIGFNRSIANIGQAKIKIQPKLSQIYQLNSVSNDSLILGNGNSNILSTAKVAKGSDIINILTDSINGEFMVQVPPVPMKIIDVQATTITKSQFKLENQPDIDMIPTFLSIDTIHRNILTVDKKTVTLIDTCTYHQKVNLTYTATKPVFTIKDMTYIDKANCDSIYGDMSFYYNDPNNSLNNDTVSLVGFDKVAPYHKYNYPFFTQGNFYKFKIQAYEEYFHPKKKTIDIVPLSGKSFQIENKLSTVTDKTDYLLDSLGTYYYQFMAGTPVLVGSYTMGMNATMDYNGSTVSWKNGNNVGIRGIILGAVPVGGVDFVTKGPDQVIAVLRDPPGSNSFASLIKGSTITSNHTYNGVWEQSSGHKFTANLGGDMMLAFGMVRISNKWDIGAGIEETNTWSGSKTKTASYSMTETISTSSSPDYVGADGDVYIANSTNIGFAKCTQLSIKPVGQSMSFTKNNSYFFIPIGDSTSFRYTQHHIINKLLPELVNLRKSILITVTDTNAVSAGKHSKYVTLLDPTNPNFGAQNTYRWVMPTSIAGTQVDSVAYYTNSIDNWKQIIRRNEMEKLRAAGRLAKDPINPINYDKINLSFDAGTVLAKSVIQTYSHSESNDFKFNVKVAVTSEAGLTVNGFGFTINNEVSGNTTHQYTDASTENYTTNYSYTLQDGDAGNYQSVDVYTPSSENQRPGTVDNTSESKYIKVELEGGPIFETRGGATSCPYEKGDTTVCYLNASNKPEPLSTPTVQIEKPGLEVLVPTIGGISSGKQASYELVLQNLSSSSTASWFQLSVDPASNPRGAIVSIDGTPLTEPRLFLVTSTPMHKIARISQSSTDDLIFENLRFVLSSPCQSNIKASAFVTAKFVPSCSDLTLQIDDRTLNSETGSDLTVILKDFDKSYKNFAGIRLQYKGINDLNWRLAKEFVLDSALMKPSKGFTKIGLDDVTLTYKFPMATDPDQTYQFRARTVCAGDIYNETATINVVKDMKKPLSMGLPSPSNGILTPESEVSVTFNENIQSEKIATTDIKVYGVLNGFTEKDNVGLAFAGSQKAFTELPLNLQSSSFTIEGKFLAKAGNTAGNIFSVGESENKVALQMIGNDLKVIAGSYSKQTVLSADANFQYFALTYDATNKNLTLYLWSNANKTKTTLFSEVLTNGVAPVGRLIVGENFYGDVRQISVWSEQRTYATISESRSTSKTGKELNLVGYWAMDEGYGTMAVDKARGRNLTVANSWFITPMGLAATLNGTTKIVAKSNHISRTTDNDFGIEFWFRGAAGQKNATLYSCVGDTIKEASKNISVAFNGTGNLTLATNGNSYLIPSGTVLDNSWHHFAFSVMRGGNASVYIDGAQKYQTSATNIGGMATDSIAFGALRFYPTGATKASFTNLFTGSIDEVRIWNNALTTENIKLNLHSKLTGNETGLIAYYPFEKLNSSGDNVYSLEDAYTPVDPLMYNGGTAIGKNVGFTADNTPAIKIARTRVPVNSNFTASDNKIVINITEDADRIENCVLEFELDRIMDLNSNRMASPLKWSAFVNMNRLKWDTENVNLTKEVLAPLTFEAVISNSSGKYENYVISGLPSWLSVNKAQGTLSPLNKTTLVFTVDNSTNVGSYECDVRLTGSKNIDEVLPVVLKVTGPKPNWAVNPYNFESSMNVIGKITIDGVYQEDSEDILAAFIGSQCVGISNPKFDSKLNSYITYMDIYGNSTDISKAITFSLWDAGTGRIYPAVDVAGSPISFVSGTITGTRAIPQLFNATDKIEQQLTLKQGWNWISSNVVSTQPSLNDQFKSGIETACEQLKSRLGYLSYSNGNWTDSNPALTIDQVSMYMLKSNQAKTLKMQGAMAKPANYSVVINPLWNWIGYVPQFVTPIKDALSGLASVEGDQVKGQIGFATYSDGNWYGSLQYMMPGAGYMYKSMNSIPTSFKYPSQYFSQSKVAKQSEVAENMRWTVDANKFQMSMTATCIASINNQEVTNGNMQVAVFVGDECRGTTTLKYVDSYNRYMAFLMVWGNMDDVNKKITFKSFNTSNNQELSLSDQSLSYVPDNIIGTPASPYKINFVIAGNNVVNMDKLKLYPNPVSDVLHFDCNTNGIEELEVIDNLGRQLIGYTHVNKNSINVSNLAPGVYTLRIKYNGNVTNHIFVRK